MVRWLLGVFASVVADVSNWGAQDYWVHTSTWYAAHCTCLCLHLCGHPTEYMKTHFVSNGLQARNYDWSSPACDAPLASFTPSAVLAVGQTTLQTHFPTAGSHTLQDMWSPTSPSDGNVPNFGFPCGGLHDEAYLRTTVQLSKYLQPPAFWTTNIGQEVQVDDVRAAYYDHLGVNVVLRCLDGAISDVVTCWDKRAPYIFQVDQADQEIYPKNLVECPYEIQTQDSCTNTTSLIMTWNAPTYPPTPAPATTPVPPTTKAPQTTPGTTPKPPTSAPLTTLAPTPSPSGEDPHEVEVWVKFFERNARCAIFGETGCTYCAKAKALLESKKAKYDYFGVWTDNPDHIPNGMDVYNALVRLTKQDTLPNIWIGGKFIGGSDDLQALETAGKLDQLLKDAKCT
ncbi:Aste57867_1957 [Aphanomyces stellatus]|uniref:Aste57867_1957 protein n=1 Tax=Aphanomyces stellatus TaxID=120398 RepID=A0A485K6J2_9STRA|nr:hypothetical protein As57867_001955 [Aphanomyces stellatus]VFT79162.1 Aste57867_1957 [Aphanomyces stellatus]